LKDLENKLVRKIFRSEIYEVRGGWRTLHIGELHCWHSSPYITGQINEEKIGEACSKHG
jgi:hypothetical protein